MVMKIEPVEGSSNVTGFGYDPASRTLAVRFASGIYHYTDVPPDVVEQLRAADSKGRFVASQIRGVFDAARVDDDDEN